MTTLLRIDSSARSDASHSRQLGYAFEARWLADNPHGRIARRDLAREPVAQITETTIAGFYTPPAEMTDALRAATALSDLLIAELESADALLITAPIYNFGPPAALKAWIDQIVRVGRTFSYDGRTFTGLVTGKPAYVALAYGAAGYGNAGPLEAFDLLKPYLQLLLGFLGFTDVTFAAVEATTDPERVEAEAAAAQAAVLARAA